LTRTIEEKPSVRLANEIADRAVRGLFERFIDACSGFSESIEVEANSVEARFFYSGQFLCRVAPYRDLFHVQIGESPSWETRVRSEAGFLDAVDKALQLFLEAYAESAR